MLLNNIIRIGGNEKMMKPRGKYQKQMYAFVGKYKNEWHSFSQDSKTKKIVNALKNKNLIKTNKFHQMKFIKQK